MPISAELAKLLSFVTDPVEREARNKELTELSENGLRQADYSRKMNELDSERKVSSEKHNKNLAWFERASKQFDGAQSELKAAQERIAALESVKDSIHLDPAEGDGELQKELASARKDVAEAQKKLGELSTSVEGFNKMVSEGRVITSERFDEEINKRGDALGAALLDVIDLEDEHRTTYGTKLDRKSLLEETQRQNGNLRQAYKVITEKVREEKQRKDIEAEVEKKYQERLKNSNVPYAPGGEPALGPLQSRLQKKDTGIPDEVAADGTGRLAGLIAQELRQEGKF